jgi:cell division protein FtsW
MKQKTLIQKRESMDPVLLWTIGLLVIFGVVMISSAGTVYADIRYEDAYFFLKRQIVGVVLGLIALFVFSRIDYSKLKSLSAPLFFISLALLVALFIPGVGTNAYGATRWLNLGPVSFQPSELAKLSMILYLGAWLSTRGIKNITRLSEGFLPFIAVVGVIAGLLLAQPDMGTLMIMLMIAGVMFFVAGGSMQHMIGAGSIGGLILLLLIRSSEYRWNRLMVFLNPDLDPQGKGYQIQQALIAIGSGGIFGLGLGNSHQKFNYLPEPAGDSIFAIIGEELGLIGTLAILLAFLVIAFRGYRIASRIPDDFGRFLAVGLTSWIVFQAFVNMGAVTGLIPLTGVTLPFISYGGSSILFSLAGMGILLNMSRYARMKG